MVVTTVAAILIGAVCVWPALFLYERGLRAMAYLEDLENGRGGMSVFLLLVARYAFKISWMALFIAIFFVLPVYFFPASLYKQPLIAYIFSFCVVWLLRIIPLNRRLRALGISPVERVRQQKIFR